MDRIYILHRELKDLNTRLNNYKSLLGKSKSKDEIIGINKSMKQINEKIKSIELILDNLKS